MPGISFTIITVVKNAEALIADTLNNILCQSYKNYELIVIDGHSADNTLSQITNSLSRANIRTKIISERDNGIYDAMNKGVRAASGQYIIFINAGDRFYSNDTLEITSKFISEHANCDIFYGDSIVSYGSYLRSLKAGKLDAIKFGMQFSHQSTFVSAELLKARSFNLQYKIASDYDFLLYAYKTNYKFRYLNIPIAITLHGGVSDSKRISTYFEFMRIVNSDKFMLNTSMTIFSMIAIECLKKPIKYILRIFRYDR